MGGDGQPFGRAHARLGDESSRYCLPGGSGIESTASVAWCSSAAPGITANQEPLMTRLILAFLASTLASTAIAKDAVPTDSQIAAENNTATYLRQKVADCVEGTKSSNRPMRDCVALSELQVAASARVKQMSTRQCAATKSLSECSALESNLRRESASDEEVLRQLRLRAG